MSTTTRPPRVTPAEPPARATPTARPADWIVPLACVLATMAVTANVVAMLGRGFEFTDGGFAWNLVVQPDDTPLVVTQAGRVEHVLFALSGHHEILFQRANAVLTLLLAIVLAGTLLAGTGTDDGRRGRLADAALAVGLGVGAFGMLAQWQAPPNYKWLGIQGLLVAGIGLLARPAGSRAAELGLGAVLGIGGWLTFMAKPPSALLLAVVALAHLAVRHTGWPRVVGGGIVAGVLVLATGIASPGSLTGFVGALRDGGAMTSELDPTRAAGGLFRPDLPPMSVTTWLVLGGTAAAVLALLWLVRATTSGSDPAPPGVRRGVPVVLAAVAILVASTTWSWWPDLAVAQGTWALALPVAVAGMLVTGRTAAPLSEAAVPRRRWADAVLLLALPAVFAFGSGNNHWHEAGRAAVFWLLAAVPLVAMVRGTSGRRRTMLVMLVVAAQLVTAALVHVGIRQPYRQDTSLRAMDVRLTTATTVEDVLVSPAQAAYVDGMVGPAQAAGFATGTGVIDLSGRSPGLLYLLGAEPLGRAWLLGGYPGSIEVATRFLAAEGCPAIAQAWVVDGPGSDHDLAPEVAPSLGLDLARDFTVVATGIAWDGVERRLLRPSRSPVEATEACQAALGEHGPQWRSRPLDLAVESDRPG